LVLCPPEIPDQNIIGATLPGMPLVVLGHNRHVAWGFTNTGPDVQDLYLEKINPANPLQYQTPDGWQAFETRQESIRVKGKADVVHTVRSTRHGPVLSDAQAAHADIIDTSKFVLALRWAALDEDNHTLVAGIRGSQALTVNDFLEAFKDYHSPMQNVVLADDQGHIAYKALGKVPVRKPGNDLMGMAPAPGWNAQYDWARLVTYGQNPRGPWRKGLDSHCQPAHHACGLSPFLRTGLGGAASHGAHHAIDRSQTPARYREHEKTAKRCAVVVDPAIAAAFVGSQVQPCFGTSGHEGLGGF
jgi:hypothetical protein